MSKSAGKSGKFNLKFPKCQKMREVQNPKALKMREIHIAKMSKIAGKFKLRFLKNVKK